MLVITDAQAAIQASLLEAQCEGAAVDTWLVDLEMFPLDRVTSGLVKGGPVKVTSGRLKELSEGSVNEGADTEVKLGSVKLGSVTLGSVEEGPVKEGPLKLGRLKLGSKVRLGPDREGSVTEKLGRLVGVPPTDTVKESVRPPERSESAKLPLASGTSMSQNCKCGGWTALQIRKKPATWFPSVEMMGKRVVHATQMAMFRSDVSILGHRHRDISSGKHDATSVMMLWQLSLQKSTDRSMHCVCRSSSKTGSVSRATSVSKWSCE